MRIEIKPECLDIKGPILDIFFENNEEAFEMGKLFHQMRENMNIECWTGAKFIRVALMNRKKDKP